MAPTRLQAHPQVEPQHRQTRAPTRPHAPSSVQCCVPSTPPSQARSRCPQTRLQRAFKHTVAFHPIPSLQGTWPPSRNLKVLYARIVVPILTGAYFFIILSFAYNLSQAQMPASRRLDALKPSASSTHLQAHPQHPQTRPQCAFKRVLDALKCTTPTHPPSTASFLETPRLAYRRRTLCMSGVRDW
jgi:hypothetical protein